MSTISLIYHLLFDFVPVWGLKFRHADWALALTAPFILLNYVFRHKNSNFKLLANFWALYVSYFFAAFFQANILVYAGILLSYTIILILLKDRHFGHIPKISLAWTVFWMGTGVVLFITSSYVLYWLLHTYWHYGAFLGAYYVLTMGTADSEPTPEKPILSGIVVSTPETQGGQIATDPDAPLQL